MLVPRVLELRVREAAEALDEQHHRRDAGARDLGGVVERARTAGGARCRRRSRHASSQRSISAGSKRIGSICQIRSQLDLDVLLGREALARLPAPGARSSARLVGVEVAQIEELLRRLDDGGDDARATDDAARRADGAVADPRGDLADLERELRRPGESVAAAGPSASSPAWAAWPVQVIRQRSTPKVPSTAPSGRSIASSTGPCSMWSSR